jgi:transposase-like protein
VNDEDFFNGPVVHFYRNVWTAVPTGKVKEVAAMLNAIHAQDDAQAAKEKAPQVVAKLHASGRCWRSSEPASDVTEQKRIVTR